jgi:hypothetical protein
MPLTALRATVATTCASVQLTTCPAMLPSQTTPGEAPKPAPVKVTAVPPTPEAGLTLAICGTFTVNDTALLMTLFCNTWALPEAAPAPTWATISASLQLFTTALALPSAA